jgi:hypothetical protein
MNITTSKANWSGEDITVRLNKKTGEFSVYGDRYRLHSTGYGEHYEIQSQQHGSNPIGHVHQWYGEGNFTAKSDFSDLVRDADCPYKAAIQVICNS